MEHMSGAPSAPAVAVLPSAAELAGAQAPSPRRDASFVSTIHELQVPAWAADALDRLYGSLFASLRHLELCGEADGRVNTWACYRHGELAGLLLYRVEGQRILVLTEMVALDAPVVQAFAAATLARHPAANMVLFNAVELRFAALDGYPHQRYAFSENFVLDLPDSVDAYAGRLGKSTRKTVKGYANRLRRDFPGFAWQAREAADVPAAEREALVRQLQAFKRASMAARGKQAALDEAETARLLQLASSCGLFASATVDGRLCAGALSCRIGDNYVMLLSAADPRLESYRLGLLACYWSVCDCIARGARQCHLLWGRYRYKEQLLAQPHDLQRLVVYRTRLHMLLRAREVWRMALRGRAARVRHWLLHEVQQKNDGLSRRVAQGVAWIRAIKRNHFRSDHLPTDGLPEDRD